MIRHMIKRWRATLLRRWHRNPDLAHTVDTLAAHQGRVAILLCTIWPDTGTSALWAALTHDMGESAVGDVCGQAKRENQKLATMLHEIEAKHADDLGLAHKVTPVEATRIKFCDKLDAYLWAKHNTPHIVASDEDWQKVRDWLYSQAMELGVDDVASEL